MPWRNQASTNYTNRAFHPEKDAPEDYFTLRRSTFPEGGERLVDGVPKENLGFLQRRRKGLQDCTPAHKRCARFRTQVSKSLLGQSYKKPVRTNDVYSSQPFSPSGWVRLTCSVPRRFLLSTYGVRRRFLQRRRKDVCPV